MNVFSDEPYSEGLGDRSRAEKTLSNPIGKYFIISQIGGSAFVDNSSD